MPCYAIYFMMLSNMFYAQFMAKSQIKYNRTRASSKQASERCQFEWFHLYIEFIALYVCTYMHTHKEKGGYYQHFVRILLPSCQYRWLCVSVPRSVAVALILIPVMVYILRGLNANSFDEYGINMVRPTKNHHQLSATLGRWTHIT